MTTRGEAFMAVLAVIDIPGLTAEQYDAVLARMGVEQRPAPGIFIHLAAPTDDGFRIVELWDDQDAFERFLSERLFPTATELGLDAQPTITVKPLHKTFAPRLEEIPDLFSGG